MLTDLQKRSAQAIINIFETGKVLGDYASVVSVKGDPGGLTYGRSQTTLMSGNLGLLITAYCQADDAEHATELQPYLPALNKPDETLNRDRTLHNILREAGRDPVMQATQDAFFDRVYWNSAVSKASEINVQSPLGIAIVYDSIVHGSWANRRDETVKKFGAASAIGEQSWIKNYVDVRRNWLATHPKIPLLRKTVYRMDAFKQIITAGNWNLDLPLNVRGVCINETSLDRTAIVSAGVDQRILKLENPFMQGEDIREVQTKLNSLGFRIEKLDGIFGSKTEDAIKQFQKTKGLKDDGKVGLATRTALGL